MCGFISFIYAVSTSSLTQKCRQSQHRQVKASLLLKNSPAFLGLQLESVSPGPRGDHLVVSAWGHGSVPQRIGPVGGMSPKGARCTPRAFLGLGCTFNSWSVHGAWPGACCSLRLPVTPLLPAFLSQHGCLGKVPAGAELCGGHSAALRPALCTAAPNLGEETREWEARWGGMWVVLTLCPAQGPASGPSQLLTQRPTWTVSSERSAAAPFV